MTDTEKTELDWNKDTHALVKFLDEDCPGIVPLKRLVQKENVEYNGSCDVRWSNGKLYRAFLICLGTREECSAKQDEIDGPDSEDDRESMCEEQNKRKRAKSKSNHQQRSKEKKPKNDFSLYVGSAPPYLPSENPAIPADKQREAESATQNHESSLKHTEDLNADIDEEEDVEEDEEEDEDEDIGKKPVHRITIDDGPANHLALPQHSIPDHDQRVIEKIDSLKKQMEDFKDSQRVWMEAKFNGIMTQINLLFASGIAKSLGPVVPPVTPATPGTTQQPPVTPAMPGTTQQPPVTPATPGITQQPPVTPAMPGTTQQPPVTPAMPGTTQQPPVTPAMPGTTQQPPVTPAMSGATQRSPLSVVPVSEVPEPLEVGTSSGIVVVNELLGSRKVVNLFTKSKNRGNFAALLNVELFDKETRKTSNVRGRGKEKLDPNIIDFVKKSCFQYYPIADENEKEAWEVCVTAIDVKNRALKKRSKENNRNAAN